MGQWARRRLPPRTRKASTRGWISSRPPVQPSRQPPPGPYQESLKRPRRSTTARLTPMPMSFLKLMIKTLSTIFLNHSKTCSYPKARWSTPVISLALWQTIADRTCVARRGPARSISVFCLLLTAVGLESVWFLTHPPPSELSWRHGSHARIRLQPNILVRACVTTIIRKCYGACHSTKHKFSM